MIDREMLDALMIKVLAKKKGIIEIIPFLDEHRKELFEIEADAEEKGLMGLGKVVNTGVRAVLECDVLYAALTDSNFDQSPYPSLVLKKGQKVVGEMIHDKDVVDRLRDQEDVYVMAGCFVVYKDKLNFPHDIMKKVCRFETPCFECDWWPIEDGDIQCDSIIFSNPVAPSDLFIKTHYFKGVDKHGLGTILIGVNGVDL